MTAPVLWGWLALASRAATGPGDEDSDGIPDEAEVDGDTDGDGTADLSDGDDDGDSVPTAAEGGTDTDNDGIPNYLDLDSDGDGLSDEVEGVDDVDLDGLSNLIDLDSDGDGALDSEEGAEDTDTDGIPDRIDEDDDGDGALTSDERPGDTDKDGAVDRVDPDDDGDGLATEIELQDAFVFGIDPDSDGDPSFVDPDSDGDGRSDSEEGRSDDDGDGTPDYLDPDSLYAAYRGGAARCDIGASRDNIAVWGLVWLLCARRRSRMVEARRWGWLARSLFALCLFGLSVGDTRAASPEVSRSRGKRDGVVVLWPRIVPETEDPVIIDLARRMQQRLEEVASASVDPRRVDVRPKPERVCPIAGCKATSLSLLLGHEGGGCALLGIVGPPDAAQQRLVQIAGRFQMEDAYLPFRTPPEGDVIVAEFVPCAEIEDHIDPDSFGLLLPKPSAPAQPAPAQPAPVQPAPAP